MKTHKNLRLKKELLIIELPEDNWITVFPKLIWINDRETGKFHHIKGSYALLGKPDEIKEKDVESLVEGTDFKGFNFYWDYINERWFDESMGATESFLSALESEIYWENPNQKESDKVNAYTDMFTIAKIARKYLEAQEKTFDRNRTLIFVTN